jgi:TonB family protein
MKYPIATIVLLSILGCATHPVQEVAKAPHDFMALNPCKDVKPEEMIFPRYPKTARKVGQEGWVAILYDLSMEGDVRNIRIVDSSPRDLFDDAAITSLTESKYPKSNKVYLNCRSLTIFHVQ